MMLPWIIGIPLIGGAAALALSRAGGSWPRRVSLAAACIQLSLAAYLWSEFPSAVNPAGGAWFLDFRMEWIPQMGISLHLAMDGIGLLMVTLTAFLGVIAVLCSWTEITERTGFFYFNLMLILGGITGVFISMDLFLFYFFWEVMLVPMYFLIGIWGHEARVYAALKFFLFTQASGLLMFLSILGLYFIHGRSTGVYTFDYFELLGASLDPGAARLLMLGFLAAFLVKLPAVPFHTWLPDAHTEAPTAGSVVLAGLLLKTGAYGILRFVMPLFPGAFADLSLAGMVVGAAGIIYGAKLAYAQTDLKRLVAYTSVSHMGFVLLGACASGETALQGVVMQMLCHGISTGALFVIAGSLKERLHTRDIGSMGGFWAQAPRMGGIAMVFAMASLGLPGLGNFVAEMLVLAGSYAANVWITAAAAAGLVFATVYSLKIIQRVFHGEAPSGTSIRDYSLRETLTMAPMILIILWLGLYPRPVFTLARPALERIGIHMAHNAEKAHENPVPETREAPNDGR
jgi:NADH-quinone oxidoreductase subunit M